MLNVGVQLVTMHSAVFCIVWSFVLFIVNVISDHIMGIPKETYFFLAVWAHILKIKKTHITLTIKLIVPIKQWNK